MKNKILYFVLSIILGLMIVGCKKKSDDPTPASTATATAPPLTFKSTDGNAYFEGNGVAHETAVKAQLTTKTLIISGIDFELQVDTIAGIVGTYNLTPTDFKNYLELTNTQNTWVSYNNTGQIVITSIDRIKQTISGYFKVAMVSSNASATFIGDFKNINYTSLYRSFMNGLLNNTNWSASNPYYGVKNNQINISGSNGFGGAPIFINLVNVTAPGTYNLTENGDYRATYYTSNFIQYIATSGQVIITEYDTVKKIIKGTFNFTAPQVPNTGTGGTGPATVTVSNGQFNIQTP